MEKRKVKYVIILIDEENMYIYIYTPASSKYR